MPAKRVIKLLDKIIWLNRKPKNIRCDNGPEFISIDFQYWCIGNEINILYSQLGIPPQNCIIERFKGTYRRAVLDRYIFRNLDEARRITQEWMENYNKERLHDTLNNLTPLEYMNILLERVG